MLFYKTAEEINYIKESCQLVGKTLAMLKDYIKPGITTLKLDQLAYEFINDFNATPAFLNYNGFPNTLCISVNDTVVHGIPSNNELQRGDIVSIDCGVLKNGFYGDSCYTFGVETISESTKLFLQTVKEALANGIEKAHEGNRLGDISNAIQQTVESKGYSVVREMVGHGIGKSLHEAPDIPNYGYKRTGLKLKRGMVLAIEPMINLGNRRCKLEDDGWTLKTKDRKLSAHFEHTIAVGEKKAEILSTFELIEK